MAKPFDATTKALVEARPLDWARFLGVEATAAEVTDADLSTVTAEADRVVQVQAPHPCLIHLEFQASRDIEMALRLLRYNILLRYRYRQPVLSAVVLLRPEANSSDLTGTLQLSGPIPESEVRFGYTVIRLWETAPELLIAAGPGLLPLTLLGRISSREMPEAVRILNQRIQGPQAALLWDTTYLLLGLRYPATFVNDLLKGVRQLKESSTYQAILTEGRVEGRVEGRAEEARALLLRLGGRRFGSASAAQQQRLAQADLEQLEELADRLLEAESWDELLRDG